MRRRARITPNSPGRDLSEQSRLRGLQVISILNFRSACFTRGQYQKQSKIALVLLKCFLIGLAKSRNIKCMTKTNGVLETRIGAFLCLRFVKVITFVL